MERGRKRAGEKERGRGRRAVKSRLSPPSIALHSPSRPPRCVCARACVMTWGDEGEAVGRVVGELAVVEVARLVPKQRQEPLHHLALPCD